MHKSSTQTKAQPEEYQYAEVAAAFGDGSYLHKLCGLTSQLIRNILQ